MIPDPLQRLRDYQDGHCAICERNDREIVVDHDHDTMLVRGLLCHRCNSEEGWANFPWTRKYRANPPMVRLGLVVVYGEHRPRRPIVFKARPAPVAKKTRPAPPRIKLVKRPQRPAPIRKPEPPSDLMDPVHRPSSTGRVWLGCALIQTIEWLELRAKLLPIWERRDAVWGGVEWTADDEAWWAGYVAEECRKLDALLIEHYSQAAVKP